MTTRRGRPSAGAALVDALEGSPLAKGRLRAVLRVLSGEITVAEACEELAISPSRFHQLRQTVLQQAMDTLEPKPRGRPARGATAEHERIAALEEEVEALKVDLRAAQVREELALVMPHVLHERQPRSPVGGKKGETAGQGTRRRRSRRRRS